MRSRSEKGSDDMTQDQRSTTQTWIDEAEVALSRAAEAIQAAWHGTREARVATLESARDATSKLGDAIDMAIAAAREAWQKELAKSVDGDEGGPSADEG
jgi:hypothetical protein